MTEPSNAPDPPDNATERDARPLERRPVRRLLARVALVGGIALAVSLVLPATPREQQLVFRFGSDSAAVRRLELSFTKRGEREPESGFTLNFPTGAPGRARHTVSLPNGDYVVTGAIERRADDAGPTETSFERRVNLQGGETVLPLESPP